MLKAYSYVNSADYQKGVIASDFGAVARQTMHDNAGRVYLGWWQARGLRMAANVMQAAANNPGSNVLVIVGSSHKAYFEAYLSQMHDIELVDLNSVLFPEDHAD